MSDFVEEDFLYKAGTGKPKSPRAKQLMADLIALDPVVREPLKVVFSKKRREFGAELNLHDKENDLNMNIAPLPDSQFAQYIRKKTNEINLSAARTTVPKYTQVNWAKKVNAAVETLNLEDLHPKLDFVALEAESKRNTNTKSLPERLQFFLKKVQPLMEKALALNETIDVFKDDFDLVHDDDMNATSAATELSIIREIKSFEYPDCKKKMISCIRFQPSHPGQKHNFLATSFVEDLTFDERVEISGRSYKNQILLWDYKDMHLFTPIISLTSTLEILTFEFKPGDPNIIVGGAINGQVLLWDLNFRAEDNLGFGDKPSHSAVESTGPLQISPAVFSILPELYSIPPAVLTEAFSKKIVNSHRNAVQSVRFLPRNVEFDKKQNLVIKESYERSQVLTLANGEINQMVTCSSDGMLIFWETKFTDTSSKRAAANKENKKLMPDYVVWSDSEKRDLEGSVQHPTIATGQHRHDGTLADCIQQDGQDTHALRCLRRRRVLHCGLVPEDFG